MCLDVRYTPATSPSGTTALAPHSTMSCAGSQMVHIKHVDNSYSAFYRPSFSSTDSVMVMVPATVFACRHLVEATTLPCVVPPIKRWLNPVDHIDDDMPVYRGLALPETRCIKNWDGSITFVLATADLADNTAGNLVEHRLALGQACFASLTASMDANGVDKANIFETADDGSVDPGAVTNFLEMLLINLMPNCNMLVCIPPFEGGVPQMKGAFSFVFRFPPADELQLPLLGLVHNQEVIAGTATQTVEEDYLCFSNFYSLTETMTAAGEEGSTLFSQSREWSLPDSIAPLVGSYAELREECTEVQRAAEREIWAAYQAVCLKMKLPPFSAENSYGCNLVGRAFATGTVSVKTKAKEEDYDVGGGEDFKCRAILAEERAAEMERRALIAEWRLKALELEEGVGAVEGGAKRLKM